MGILREAKVAPRYYDT